MRIDLAVEWQKYAAHFGRSNDGARHAFYMGWLCMLKTGRMADNECLVDIAAQLDLFLAEDSAGCVCDACAALRARGMQYSLVKDLFPQEGKNG